MKGHAIVDHLVDNPLEGYQPIIDLFPYESILDIEPEEEQSNLLMYFGGTINLHEKWNQGHCDLSY